MAIRYTEYDILDYEAINRYMQLSDEELDKLLEDALKEVENNK